MTVTIPTIYNPDGIDANGMNSVVLVPAIADTNAPTVAEMSAGIVISCALDGFTTSVELSRLTYKKYCDKNNRQRSGTETWSYENLIVEDDPQRVDTSGMFDYLDEIVVGQKYWLVDIRGIDAKEWEPAAGQHVDVHPITVDTQKRGDYDPNAEGATHKREYIISAAGDIAFDVEVVA